MTPIEEIEQPFSDRADRRGRRSWTQRPLTIAAAHPAPLIADVPDVGLTASTLLAPPVPAPLRVAVSLTVPSTLSAGPVARTLMAAVGPLRMLPPAAPLGVLHVVGVVGQRGSLGVAAAVVTAAVMPASSLMVAAVLAAAVAGLLGTASPLTTGVPSGSVPHRDSTEKWIME